MFATAKPARRVRLAPALAAVAVALAGTALAHHPGSHATRLPDRRVRVEVVALATDSCTRIGEIVPGTPPAVKPVRGTVALIARLVRQNLATCALGVTAVKGEAALDLGADVRQILIYILATDGLLASSERVKVQ